MVASIGILIAAHWPAWATTYNEIMSRATTEEKPAQAKSESDHPVLVRYEVGDTSGFFTRADGHKFYKQDSEESEWDELEE
ncbi:MAG: hypothetical protein HY586_05915 [Candidatus Omnitrophica bacterium]|nr:hypothetical protein [Candidatus Omnitrophota bacterium]